MSTAAACWTVFANNLESILIQVKQWRGLLCQGNWMLALLAKVALATASGATSAGSAAQSFVTIVGLGGAAVNVSRGAGGGQGGAL